MKCSLWADGKPCMLCVCGVRGKEFFPGHRGHRRRGGPINGEGLMAIKRSAGAGSDDRGSGALGGGDFGVLYPTVWEYISSDKYDDGSARETSTLLLFVEAGSVKGCFNDRGEGRKCWVTGCDVESMLTSLESQLASGRVEWRVDKGPPKKR